MIRKFLKNNTFFFICLTFISGISIYLLNKELIDVYLATKYIGGWDGSGHFSIGKYYADNIFPSVWGWVPNWYNGMPFPQFYPPLFYYLLALAYNSTNISYDVLFRYFLILMSFTAPVFVSLIYYYKINKSKIQTLFVLIISIIFISVKSKIGFVGISLSSLLNNGLATQPLAFILLVLWLFFFLDLSKNKINKYYAGLFLFLIFLANAHVVLVAFFFFVSIFIINFIKLKNKSLKSKEFWNFIFLYFFSGFVPLLIASFWYVPMLTYYSYSTSSAIGFYWDGLSQIFIKHYYISLTFIVGLFLFKKIDTLSKSIILISLLLIILELFGINILLSNLPIHIERWLGTIYFLYPILIISVINNIKEYISSNFYYKLLIFIIIVTSSYTVITSQALKDNLRGIYIDSNFSKIEPILDYFKDKDGLIMIEAHTQYSAPADKVLNAYLGEQGNKTIYTIIRESAISSLFYTPIRNALSYENECWGINCNLSFNEEYLNDDFEKHLKNSIDYGVEYFLIRSAQKKKDFDDSDLVEKVNSINEWHIYKSNVSNKIIIPKKEPVLVISDLESKKDRPVFDFVSLVENINVRLHRSDIVFAKSNDVLIDEINDLERFRVLIISEYKYKDFNLASKKLDDFVKKEGNFLIATYPKDRKNLIYNYIDVLNEDNKNILFFDEEIPEEEVAEKKVAIKGLTYIYKEKDIYEKLTEILDEKIPSTNIPEDIMSQIEFEEENQTIFIKKSNLEIPIVINSSYHPAWRSIKGNDLYMSSLTNKLVYTKESDSVYFETPKAVIWGHLLSFLGIMSILYFIYRED